MTCINPPQLEDTDLLAHLDGEAGASVAEHLAACEHCRVRSEKLAQAQAELAAALHRVDCPDPLQLAEHQAGLLAAEETTLIEKHLELCHHCQQEVEHLTQFQADTAPALEVSAVNRVKVLVGELISRREGPASLTLQPSLAGTRGGEEALKVFEAGDVRLTLAVQPDPDAPGKRTVHGLITEVEVAECLVQVHQDADRVAEASVDQHGNFNLTGLPPGEYAISVKGRDFEFALPSLILE